MITTIIYSICMARNNKIFNEKDTPVHIAVEKALQILHDYQRNNCSSINTPSPSNSRNNKSWSPPPRTYLKLNVDAHLKDDGHWGLGMVLRREDDRCVGAVTKVMRRSHDATSAEAHGLVEALKWTKAQQLIKVMIEMDAKVIVRALQKKEVPRSCWGQLLKACIRDFDQETQISLNWISREGNKVAHELARWAFTEPNMYWTSNNYPFCILPHLQNDMGSVS
ncbi:hypothetical protein TSUD_398380 [Trifolium subterraneum]|uniref:RNase H type-1 domain-containing protein n=1 Tax=Trifolium subterraneum TaxID=3900 RepID=A0A2Z6P075_TRISU|nr:hypothetical protein TSUD_398380 [Trifolium subterraneum]